MLYWINFLWTAVVFSNAAFSNTIVIEGRYSGTPGEIVELVYWHQVPGPDYRGGAFSFIHKSDSGYLTKTGNFKFQIESSELIHFTLYRQVADARKTKMLSSYVAEPGDDIFIEFRKENGASSSIDTIIFRGEGAEKYTARYKVDSLWEKMVKYWTGHPKKRALSDLEHAQRQFERISLYEEKAFGWLDHYHDKISAQAQQVLMADIFGKNMYRMYKYLSIKFSLEKRRTGTADIFPEVKRLYKLKVAGKILDVPDHILAHSESYPSFLIKKIKFESEFIHEDQPSVSGTITSDYSGILAERLITEFLAGSRYGENLYGENNIDFRAEIDDAISKVSNPVYKQVLEYIKRNQTIGAQVYDFELPDKYGNIIRLSDYKGKVVILDFWFTGCGGCLQFYQNILSKAEKYFKDNEQVVFITISIDTRRKWLRGLESGEYVSSQSINLFTNGQGGDHPIIYNLSVWGYPTAFVVDSEGRIFENDQTDLRNADKLISIVESALETRTTDGNKND